MNAARGRGGVWIATALACLTSLAPVRTTGAQDDSSQSAPLSQGQLEQLVAPIALYPDSLVAQILMASTYPLEVVEAARWVKANPKVTGKALEDAMQKQSWDASVKSLTAFPQVLDMMDTKLDWTTQLGDAFLAQQKDVMNAVQVLRQKAQAEGNLESNEQQKVVVEQQPSGTQPQTIVIEQANPQVVYVPTYNPTVVYGTWPYPAYPPYSYYPPGYAVAGSLISFGVGMAVGSALWGNCNWGGGDVNVNVNRYNNFNRTDIKNGNWNHNSEHRRGAQYRNQDVRNRYGKGSQANAQSRDAFRGRAEQGRQQIARGDADRFKQGGAADRGRDGGVASRQGAGSRDSVGQRDAGRSRSAAQRSPQHREASAFGGMGHGNDVRREASRGRSSRASAGSFGGGGHRSGGGGFSRGGGGGGRGGGGRRR